MRVKMKETAFGKSWDDVFPDNHSLEFPVPETSNGYMFDADGQATPARHWRSNSIIDEKSPSRWDVSPRSFENLAEGFKCTQNGLDRKKKHSKNSHLISLEQDVVNLQTKFQCEQTVKRILEQALGRASSVNIATLDNFTPKPTQDLIREIAFLELEVANLEQHLLLLYRNTFDQSLKWASDEPKEENVSIVPPTVQNHQRPEGAIFRSAGKQITPYTQYYQNQSAESEKDMPHDSPRLIETRARQSTSACASSTKERHLLSSHSQPILLPEEYEHCSLHQMARDEQQHVFFKKSREGTPCRQRKENLIGSHSPLSGDPICRTPNKLSEDLVGCMAAIYCKLAEPPLPQLGGLMSPSSSSSASTFSAQRFSSDGWTSQYKTDSSCDVSSSDAAREICATECLAASPSPVEVHWICVDNDRLTFAARMLRNFRSLVQQLEKVDPGQLNHEQKLAFWINIHNALMMHAYLAFGIPRNHLRRVSLLQKAAYKIGSHSINAQTIEQTVLRCRSHRPAKWLQSFLSPAAKLRGDGRQAYAIDRLEPLLCFALCCGGRSDPMVRMYTESCIYEELEAAKRDFLQANVRMKENKVQLPRMLESFAREAGMGCCELLDWVCEGVTQAPELTDAIAKCTLQSPGKEHKCVDWVPYDFTFRYVFASPLSSNFLPP